MAKKLWFLAGLCWVLTAIVLSGCGLKENETPEFLFAFENSKAIKISLVHFNYLHAHLVAYNDVKRVAPARLKVKVSRACVVTMA